jgi:hypothetical protein
LSYIISVGDVGIVCNLYLTFVEVEGCFNRLIINFSGAFFTIGVVEQEVIGIGDNKIISGEDGCCSIELDNSIKTRESSDDFIFSSNSSSSSVSH